VGSAIDKHFAFVYTRYKIDYKLKRYKLLRVYKLVSIVAKG